MKEEHLKNIPLESKTAASEAEEKDRRVSPDQPKPSQSVLDEVRKGAKDALEEIRRGRPPHMIIDPTLGSRRYSPWSEGIYFADPTGTLQVGAVAKDEGVSLTMSREQFEQLTDKTQEILSAAALAQERIAKDQEEIDLLKTETRALLKRMRAA